MGDERDSSTTPIGRPRRTRRAAIGAIASALTTAAAVGSRAASAEPRLDDRGGWIEREPIAADLPPNRPPWMNKQGELLKGYGTPSPFQHDVVRVTTDLTPTELSSWNFTPLQHLYGIITPNGLHYERSHAGTTEIDPSQHRLLVDGLVSKPIVLTMADLMRFPTVSRTHFIECSGNTLTEWKKPTGKDVQHTHGLLSCAEWTGVPVREILDRVGVDPKATWALAEGADAAAMDRSIPVSKLRDDALLAFAQNGEMLRPSQGYPLRLLLPGYEGNMSIKWLRRLTLGKRPFETYEETAYYTELYPSGRARQFNFIMDVKSVITFPSASQTLREPGYCQITGLAWSGNGRIKRVDVSVDGGRTWRAAALQGPIMSRCLTRFRYDWAWDGEPVIVQSRSTDEYGHVQPTRGKLIAERGSNSVYHYNAIQSWAIAENGEVTNVFA